MASLTQIIVRWEWSNFLNFKHNKTICRTNKLDINIISLKYIYWHAATSILMLTC